MYNGIKEAAKQPALLAPILGFINPVTAVPILAAGIIVYAVIKIFKNDDNNKKEPLLTVAEPLNRPSPSGSPTVKATVPSLTKSLIPTVQTTVNEPLDNAEIIKKEMIRRAMSELGKRSGKARARKRDQQHPGNNGISDAIRAPQTL